MSPPSLGVGGGRGTWNPDNETTSSFHSDMIQTAVLWSNQIRYACGDLGSYLGGQGGNCPPTALQIEQIWTFNTCE